MLQSPHELAIIYSACMSIVLLLIHDAKEMVALRITAVTPLHSANIQIGDKKCGAGIHIRANTSLLLYTSKVASCL
jgi:hypothetical protein